MPNIEVPTLGEWIAEEPCKGAFASKFFGLYGYMGVLQAFCEEEITLEETSGSSSGGYVAAMYAAGLEPLQMLEPIEHLRRQDIWDAGWGLGVLRGDLFEDKLREILPVNTLEECDVPTNISTFDLHTRKTDVRRKGDIARAIRATCAVPGLFQPVTIDGELKLDGGITDHEGIAGLYYDDRVVHIGFSQKRRHNRLREEFTNMAKLRLEGIVSVTPLSLARGPQAFTQAYDLTKEALSQPVVLN